MLTARRTGTARWADDIDTLAGNDRLERKGVERISRIIAVSSFRRDRLGERYHGAAGKCTVRLKFGAILRPRDTVVTRFRGCSRLVPWMRFAASRTCTKSSPRQGGWGLATVSAIGLLGKFTNSYVDELGNMIRDLELTDRAAIVCRETREEVLRLHEEGALYLLGSCFEAESFRGFNIVFPKGGPCGMPVLTPRGDGICNYAVDGENGVMAKSHLASWIEAAQVRHLEGYDRFSIDTIRAKPESHWWRHIAARVAAPFQNRIR